MDIKLYKVKLTGGGHIWNYGNDEEKSAKVLAECAARKTTTAAQLKRAAKKRASVRARSKK